MTATTRPTAVLAAATAPVVHPVVRPVIESLEGRRLLAAPQLGAIGVTAVPVEHTVQIPVNGFDADGDRLDYAVSSDNPALVPSLRAAPGNTFIEMDVAYTFEGSPTTGTLVFALFDEAAPETVATIRAFTEAGLYDGLSFHRVIEGFVNQGGDPAGTGTGDVNGDGVGDFDAIEFGDEFDPDLMFTGEGQLAMANRGKDTNTTQFFVTAGPQRGLDFNHTIFGQLVGGYEANRRINAQATNGQGTPINPVTITDARVADRPFDAVVQVRSAGTLASGNVTVTVTDPDGQAAQRTFRVDAVQDLNPLTGEDYDQPPILGDVPQVIFATPGEPVTFGIDATDNEGDDFEIQGRFLTAYAPEDQPATSIDQDANTVTVTPPAGSLEPIEIEVGVRQVDSNSRGSTGPSQNNSLAIFDTQKVTIVVSGDAIEPQATAVSALAGRPILNARLASFTIPGNPPVGDLTAFVNWADGTFTENAPVIALGGGEYEVRGTKTYASDVLAPIDVTLTNNVTGAFATADSQIFVRPDAELVDGRLRIWGDDQRDEIGVTVQGDNLRVYNAARFSLFPLADVGLIEIQTFDGNDYVEIASGTPAANISAGAGNDEVYGGDGNDSISGGPDADYILGRDGNDEINGDGGNDVLSGGAGKNTIAGGEGDDRLNGSGGRDLLFGEGGNDRLYGRGGNDTLDGGGNVDRLFGDDASGPQGDDLLRGGNSADKLYGRGGNDTLIGGRGRDLFFGGDGNDTAFVDDEDDTTNPSLFESIEEIA